jgi:ribonucleoside-diphosphate reductase alpha chain
MNFAKIQMGPQEQVPAVEKSGVVGRGKSEPEKVAVKKARTNVASGNACPECGMSINHESGCVVCTHCGYSKCG